MEGIVRLHEKIVAGVPPAYELRKVGRRDVAPTTAAAGIRRGEGGSTGRRRSSSSASGCSTPPAGCATQEGFNFLSDVTSADYLGWGETGVAGYWGNAAGRDTNAPGLLGLRERPRAEAPPLRGLLPPACPALGAASACACRSGATTASPVAQRRADLAHGRLARARGLRPHGHRLRRPPEPRADPHARGLGGPSASQGLPDRRRAGPVLGGGVDGHRRDLAARREEPVRHGPGDRTARSTTAHASRSRSRRSCSCRRSSRKSGDVLTVNFGPNHPSTHGVLRLVVSLDGETVVGLTR